MAEAVVGLIASISEILGISKALYSKSMLGRQVREKLERVKELAVAVQNAFTEERRVRYTTEVLAVADRQLPAVEQILKSIHGTLPVAPQNPSKLEKLRASVSLLWFGLRRGGSVNKKLDDIVVKLESTFREIMLIMNAGAGPTILLPDDNPISIGLDRAVDVLRFLSTSSLQVPAVTPASSLPQAPASPPSSSQAQAPLLRSSSSSPQAPPTTRASGLHIVGIVGQGGLGKNTLLIHILQKSQRAFNRMAYDGFVDERPDKRALQELQASLLGQLGMPHREARSLLEGKRELMKSFETLQNSGESVCIAIDNVWREEDLQHLLPHNFADSLPSLKICIMITSRVRSIVDRLSGLCGGNPEVHRFEPQILPEPTSRALLLANANWDRSNPVLPGEFGLIDGIFPLCGGLPLALTLAGSLFKRQRGAEYWEEWMKGMEPGRAGVPLERIDNILDLSFKNLSHKSKEALLDIGACLCGWRWEAVESIVGAVELHDLKDYSLIDCVRAQGRRTNEQVVKMHDLIRKLAATKRDNSEIIIWNPDTWPTSLLSDERIHHSVRFLRLNVGKAEESQLSNSHTHLVLDGSCFAHMKKLQVLDIVFGSFKCPQLLLPVSLRFLKLEDNRHLTEANIPSQLQQLELKGCVSLKQLPASIYECENLRYLCIVGSPRLRGFRSYTRWTKLSTLWLEGCSSVTTLPSDLVALKWLTLIDCGRMENLPSLYRSRLRSEDVNISGCLCKWPQASSMLHQPLLLPHSIYSSVSALHSRNACPGPKKRSFINVIELQGLSPDELNTLENLTISECDNVQALWLVLVNMVSLKKLKLINNCRCSQLGEVPDEMQNLTKLKLMHFDQLRVLPDSICNLQLLVVLSLSGCAQLQELPREIGNLFALEKLVLDGCEGLVRLPNTVCRLEVLKELNMIRCSKLGRLPEEMGKMRSLLYLRLGTCSNLQILPRSICELKFLRELDMAWCTRLETLPENLGNLGSLRNLRLGNCSSLTKLPHSILNLAHVLSVLDLKECPLIELPEQLQGMECVRR